MAEINQNYDTSSSPENQNKKKLDRRKARQKWGATETSLLVEGLYKHGVGNWKKILTDPKYPFPRDRTAVDLKDRFRTIYPNEYEKLYGKKAKRKKNKSNDNDSLSELLTFVRKPHRSKNKFTPEEDNALKLGVEKYGNSWSKIASDQKLNLTHRTGQDLRDRCRVAFPETYARSRFIKSRKSNYIEQPDSQILKKFYALPFQALQKSETSDV